MLKNYMPGISWAILIFILSSISTGKLHLPDFWDLFSMDKAAHAIFYFIFYYLWARGLMRSQLNKKSIYIILLLFCIIYGALLELYQGYFLSNRIGSWADGLANAIGASAAYFYFRPAVIKIIIFKKRQEGN